MTAAEANTLADESLPAIEQADFDKVMEAIVAAATLGQYELSYTVEKPMKATLKKLQDPPNSYGVKDLWDNEGRILIKW